MSAGEGQYWKCVGHAREEGDIGARGGHVPMSGSGVQSEPKEHDVEKRHLSPEPSRYLAPGF